MTTLADRPNTALLVIDVQNGVVAGSHDRDGVVANIDSLVDKARAEDVPVVWVQHSDEELRAGQRRLAVRARARPDDGRAARAQALRRLVRGHRPRRRCWPSRGVGRLVVTGAQTDACIRSTLHGALVRGYDATLVGDAHTTEDLTAYGAPPPEAGDRPHQPVLEVPDGARPQRGHRRHRRRELLRGQHGRIGAGSRSAMVRSPARAPTGSSRPQMPARPAGLWRGAGAGANVVTT